MYDLTHEIDRRYTRYLDMAAGAHTFKKAKKQTVKNTKQETLEL